MTTKTEAKEFKFSKGTIWVDGTRAFGKIKATTSIILSPGDLSIDAEIGNFGPISINEDKRTRWKHTFVGLFVCMITGLIIASLVALSYHNTFYYSAHRAVKKIYNIMGIFSILSLIAGVATFMLTHVKMAQFPHNGQTVYVPSLEGNDLPVMEALDAYITSLKHDHHIRAKESSNG